MASAAEQLAANLNFSAFAKADELKKRIWFTLGAACLSAGHLRAVAGIDPNIWSQIFKSQAGGILGMFNMFAGGGINRMAIFALNIMPYISASIILQLLTTVSPQLEALKKEGSRAARSSTSTPAISPSCWRCSGLRHCRRPRRRGQCRRRTRPVLPASTTITLVGGTMFLMWLGEQITSRGIGNGISLIIMAGIVAELPSAIAGTLELGRRARCRQCSSSRSSWPLRSSC